MFKLTVIISLYFINFLIAGLPGLMGAAIAHFALTAIEMRKIKRKIEFNDILMDTWDIEQEQYHPQPHE